MFLRFGYCFDLFLILVVSSCASPKNLFLKYSIFTFYILILMAINVHCFYLIKKINKYMVALSPLDDEYLLN